MGYTHYWSFDPTHPEADHGIGQTILDAQRITQTARIPLAADVDTPEVPPVLAEGLLRCNGVGDDGHEPLTLARHPDRHDPVAAAHLAAHGFIWTFCKTARKPYDLVVCAILLRAVTHMPTAVAIESDGDWEREWRYGAASPNTEHRNPEAEPAGARALVRALFGAEADPEACPFRRTVDGPPASRDRTGPSIPATRPEATR